MKRILFAALVVLALSVAALPAWAQTTMWIDTSEGDPTLRWLPVLEKVDGDPFPAGEVVKYDCYLVNAVTDPGKVNPALVTTARIVEEQFVIDLGGTEGRYFAGVQSIRTLNDEVLARSDISWSDNPEVVLDGIPFGLKLYVAPKAPAGLATGE